MPPPPKLLSGLREIAPEYDALVCDVWGVLHDGHKPFPAAAHALREFRAARGPVILLSNAPRMPFELLAQFERIGVPTDCYDAIVTSGGAARDDLAQRARQHGPVALYYIGPERDISIIEGLAVESVPVERAELALCVGLVDDLVETPEDYAGILGRLRARNLTMLCANPDIRVHRGAQLVWCAGALAADYEKLGGEVRYFGKPHKPIYDAACARAPQARKWLAIGDGLMTDIKGAAAAAIDALFIAEGVHGDEAKPYTQDNIARLFAGAGVDACAAMRALVW